MMIRLRQLIASALYPTRAYNLPSVCARYGLEPGDESEAFSSKTRYVASRLIKLTDQQVLSIAKAVAADFPDDDLQAAVEQIDGSERLVSNITRQSLSKALDKYSLAGKSDLLEFLRTHFPRIDQLPSAHGSLERTVADDIIRHSLSNDDWDSSEVLKRVGFLSCSQSKLFSFLADLVHPIRRDHAEQEEMVAAINLLLRRDGFSLDRTGQVSGYPLYQVQKADVVGVQPADELISRILISFDESGVHDAWRKALDRRLSDPEGAITAAKSLLETVCKHLIEQSAGAFKDNDDLPKLYSIAAEHLNLAPTQHSETIFRSILGNCQSVVGNLAGLRNKLGDSHGQSRHHVKPQARHAELAVNLAGSMAMFLVSTWNSRKR